MTLDYLLRLSDGAFTGPANRARGAVDKLNSGVGGVGKNAAGVTNLSNSFQNLALKIGAAFTAWKVGEVAFGGLSKSVRAAADMETTATAFKTLLGSAGAAEQVLGRIKKLAAETPFEFPELATAGKALLALGEAANEVPDTLRRIGDIASGVAAPIGEIAEIYGKARNQWTLSAEDINQLTGRGIPIIREFASVLGVSQDKIKDMAADGQITFPLLDQSFRRLTGQGGQFFRMMAAQSATTNGLLSSLSDTANDLFLELGKPLNDALRPVLKDAMSIGEALKPLMARIGVEVGGVVTATRNFVMEAEKGGGVVVALGEKLKSAVMAAGSALMIPVMAMGEAMAPFGQYLMAALTPTMDWLGVQFEIAGLRLGRVVMQQLSAALAGLPAWLVGDAPLSLNRQANAAGKQSNLLAEDAKVIGNVVKEAWSQFPDALSFFVTDFQSALSSNLDKFLFNLKGGEQMGQLPEFKSEGMRNAVQVASTAPGLEKALEAAAKATTANTEAVKTKALGETGGGRAPDSASGKIRSVRDGTTKAQASASNTNYGSESQFDLLQQKRRMGVSSWAGAAGYGPQGKISGRMGGGLDWLHQVNPELPRVAAGKDMAKRFANPKIQSPGAAQVNEKKASAAAKTAEKIQGGGGDRPRWDLVAQIAANTANLKVIK